MAPIGSLATGEPISIAEKLTLRSIAAVLAELDIGAVVVRRGDDPPGVVSERDIVTLGTAPLRPVGSKRLRENGGLAAGRRRRMLNAAV